MPIHRIKTPLSAADLVGLAIGDRLQISGVIYSGRDAILPKLVRLAEAGTLAQHNLSLIGSVILHTAVSPAGIGPTSSNKYEIESSIPALSAAGVKIHIGKGALRKETIAALNEHSSIFAVTPPVTALLTSTIVSRRIVAFAEEGMEAMHELVVKDFPAIVAVAHGQSLLSNV